MKLCQASTMGAFCQLVIPLKTNRSYHLSIRVILQFKFFLRWLSVQVVNASEFNTKGRPIQETSSTGRHLKVFLCFYLSVILSRQMSTQLCRPVYFSAINIVGIILVLPIRVNVLILSKKGRPSQATLCMDACRVLLSAMSKSTDKLKEIYPASFGVFAEENSDAEEGHYLVDQ